MVCESILNCDKLVFERKDFWLLSFELISKWIHSVDYKGVREIMKVSWNVGEEENSGMPERIHVF
jgi:hypothetical protein